MEQVWLLGYPIVWLHLSVERAFDRNLILINITYSEYLFQKTFKKLGFYAEIRVMQCKKKTTWGPLKYYVSIILVVFDPLPPGSKTFRHT